MSVHTTRENAIRAVDFELREREMAAHEYLCESQYCLADMGMPPHPAAWWARSQCGVIDQVCEYRRHECRRMGGWWCRPVGCHAHHGFARIGWIPIPGK